ncbi:hypothetical protein CKA32_002624 [Geitlerinema sp. FC II]|nr:hypothetical protein CKA32_002624 [Geitlerinema sp. FC II]
MLQGEAEIDRWESTDRTVRKLPVLAVTPSPSPSQPQNRLQ